MKLSAGAFFLVLALEFVQRAHGNRDAVSKSRACRMARYWFRAWAAVLTAARMDAYFQEVLP